MEPIIALASAPMKSALAIIRASGDNVFSITNSIFSKDISDIKERSIIYGEIIDKGETLDQVVLLLYPAPNSNTGEDVVEICCHGSMLIADQIIALYIAKGVRYASRGEFTSRAFINGKMDLIEAESINDLINATTVEAKNLSMLSLKGETSSLFYPIKDSIAYQLALLETNIDFPEYEDIREVNYDKIIEDCKEINAKLATLIKSGEEGKIIKEGIKVALVGEPNAGKSSLLNAFLNEDKAIVSSIPGTTRDIVEGDVNIKGLTLHLLDTAGYRDTSDVIEEIGVKKSKKSIEEADLIILLIDYRNKDSKENLDLLEMTKDKKRLIVYNKKDLIDTNPSEDGIYISALNKDISPLINAIYNSFALNQSSFSRPSFNNARQLGILRKIYSVIDQVIIDAQNEVTADILSSSLFVAYNACRELLGEDSTRDLTDEIFSRFCVGK